MQLIGLAGPARSGKDTIAKHLVKAHEFQAFSFSDELYKEVAAAFRLDEAILRDAKTKDTDCPLLKLKFCSDEGFVERAVKKLDEEHKKVWVDLLLYPTGINLSPRWILQTWGTEYRREQDPRYWIDKATNWVIDRMLEAGPDVMHLKLVNTSARYPNEIEWIRSINGNLWHVRKQGVEPLPHSSDNPPSIESGDNVVHNNGTINSLWSAVTMMLGSRDQVVHVEYEEVTA